MIVKRLYLNMENWAVSRGSYQLGYIAENQVTLLQIATEIDPNCTYHLEHEINGESYILYLEKGDGVLTATIPNTMLTNKGNANWQIVGIWADESVKKSNIFSVYISDSINAENEVPASEITAFTEALADLAGNMSEVAAYAESASASASNASTSASNASESAESASAAAESASASAESASTSAESASTYATNASASASEASTHATNASESATNASESASEANTSARNAGTSASEASASADEASEYATNASASATTATERASLASSAATSAQTYAANASTSEQSCATYASNASASAEEAREYVESLDNWTTVEFTLADFLYDENSGVTYLRVEAPSGYEIAEIKGYMVLNKTEVDNVNLNMVIDMTKPQYVSELAGTIISVQHGTNVKGWVGTLMVNINLDLLYSQSILTYALSANNKNWANAPIMNSVTSRAESIAQSGKFETTSFTIKTNIPHANISEFYGKLQYRVVPAT
jgi:chemotaxis protein histidine kinase CheA